MLASLSLKAQWRSRGVLLGSLALLGCGLISSDITTIKFSLPQRSYSFDAASIGTVPPGTLVPTVSCTDTTLCCAAATAAQIPCSNVACEGSPMACTLHAVIETQPQTVNLKMEVPSLSSINSQTLSNVTVSQIKYDITANTLNVDLPPVELFLAPGDATTASDSRAQRFGTVPMTPRGSTPKGATVTLDPVGQQAFSTYVSNFNTPFVFLARTTVVVTGGNPVPSGRVDITVVGQVSVKPSL